MWSTFYMCVHYTVVESYMASLLTHWGSLAHADMLEYFAHKAESSHMLGVPCGQVTTDRYKKKAYTLLTDKKYLSIAPQNYI